MQLFHILKDYFYSIYQAGFAAIAYAVLLPLTFILILTAALTGYAGKLLRGSAQTLRFFREKAWVDNSNFSQFVRKCVRRFPYSIRVNFNLYANSERPLTDFFINKFPKDYALRERAYKYIYDLVVFGGGIAAFIHIINVAEFSDALNFLLLPLAGLTLRYALSLALLIIEMRCRRLYLKTVDVMNNGIFLIRSKDEAPEETGIEEDDEETAAEEPVLKNFGSDGGPCAFGPDPSTAKVGETH